MNLREASTLTYEICIVGSGPAGIIFVLEYARHNPGHRILIIEFGYKGQNAENSLDKTIDIKNSINHHNPYNSTNKGFGGTTSSWGGRCVMYDEVDFIDRPVVDGGCTWDLDLYKEVSEYTPLAARYFECGDAEFNLHEIDPKHGRIAEGFKEGIVTDSVVERWSRPTRFGSRYFAEIADNPNIILVEGGEARAFSIPDAKGNVQHLKVRDVVSRQLYTVSANKFILAAGARETTRLLLRNPQIFNNLNHPPEALGKYYQGHLTGKMASVRFYGDPRKTDFGFIRDKDGTYLRRRFQFSSDFLVEQNLLNTAIWLDNPVYYDPKHRNGAMSLMYLSMLIPFLGRKLAPPAIAYSVTKDKRYKIPRHLLNIIKDLPSSLITPAKTFYKRYCLKRKLPGVFLYNPHNTYALFFHAEQKPVPSNRLELGSDGETLVVHYEITEDDVHSVIKSHQVLDQWLRSCHCGELEYWYKEEDLPEAILHMSKNGAHQMGTTRIADSPKEGVVNRDLKVWGTSNVYVCSSSVLPTSGQANPTFVLGAFAARLADRLTANC